MAVFEPYKMIFSDVAGSTQNITIDLVARYAAAFGMMAVGKLIDKYTPNEKADVDFGFEVNPQKTGSFDYSKLEVPGIDPLEFNAVLHGEQGLIFAPPLLMSFNQDKSLIETEVNDDDPIVVERWGTKPWDITINGLLIDLKNRIYPTDEIRRLNQNWKYNGVVKVVGMQFEELDIDSVYFRSISFTRVEGYSDTVQFSINASSIKAVNFTLLKPNS